MTVLYEPETAVEPIVEWVDILAVDLDVVTNRFRSIVFVHGLQGHPRNTWTWEADSSQVGNLVPIESGEKKSKLKFWSKRNKTASNPSGTTAAARPSAIFWPYHFLPQDCPNSHILTWGYDSKVSHFFDGAANRNNVLSHSRDLLGDLTGQRGSCVR
jgi:ankyrin repeat domain-containing protein 50